MYTFFRDVTIDVAESEVAVKVLSKKRLLWRAEESGETLLLRHIKQEKGVLESLHANTLKSPFLMEYMGAFQVGFS